MNVNTNIAALQSFYYYKLNISDLSSTLEKISTGLRVNNAVDNPTGAALSDRLRSYIGGLKQATENANKGLSLGHAAQKGMDDILTHLQNIYDLVEGASTAQEDVQNIQNQVNQEIESIRQIAQNTEYESKRLLMGGYGPQIELNGSNLRFLGLTKYTRPGSYTINVSSPATRGYALTQPKTYPTFTGPQAENGAKTNNPNASMTFSGELFQYGSGQSSYKLTVGNNKTLDQVISIINSDPTISSLNIVASKVTDSSQRYLKLESATRIGSFSVKIDVYGGGANAYNLDHVTGLDKSVTYNSSGVSVNSSNYSTVGIPEPETVRFKDTESGETATVTLATGTTFTQAIDQINYALKVKKIKAEASWTGSQIMIRNKYPGSANTIMNEMSHSTPNRSTSLGFNFATDIYFNIASGAQLGGADGSELVGNINGNEAQGSGYKLTSVAGGSRGLSVLVPDAVYGNLGEVKVAWNSLDFQTGQFNNQNVSLSINDFMPANLGISAGLDTLNLDQIDLTRPEGVGIEEGLAVTSAAINEVESQQSNIESFMYDIMKRSIGVLQSSEYTHENAESAITDANKAQESLEETKILLALKFNSAVLAQANVSPGVIMRHLDIQAGMKDFYDSVNTFVTDKSDSMIFPLYPNALEMDGGFSVSFNGNSYELKIEELRVDGNMSALAGIEEGIAEETEDENTLLSQSGLYYDATSGQWLPAA